MEKIRIDFFNALKAKDLPKSKEFISELILKKGTDELIIIIDGIPLTDSLKEKITIDPNAIKTFTILSREKMKNMTLCRGYDGDVILITTK